MSLSTGYFGNWTWRDDIMAHVKGSVIMGKHKLRGLFEFLELRLIQRHSPVFLITFNWVRPYSDLIGITTRIPFDNRISHKKCWFLFCFKKTDGFSSDLY